NRPCGSRPSGSRCGAPRQRGPCRSARDGRVRPAAGSCRTECGTFGRGARRRLTLRIIAGTHRGRRIAAPKGGHTRPTGDRVREALFNLVGPVDGASVLDLYAGSGALGLEALSRGARRCVFVETDGAACRAIRANLETLGLIGGLVTQRDSAAVLREERAARRSPPRPAPHTPSARR